MKSGIKGVRFIEQKVVLDDRGSLSTLFSEAREPELRYPQWNLVRSLEKVLRGLHAHTLYDELYIALAGRLFFALKDARFDSPTFGEEMSVWSDELGGLSLLVPKGVAHAVYFETEGSLLYGLSDVWTGNEEFECRFDDPDVTVDWPDRFPVLSDKDRHAGTFAQMVDGLKTEEVRKAAVAAGAAALPA